MSAPFPLALYIMGAIGAGKSTLCRDASAHAGCVVFDEYVCEPFLRDYIAEPAASAFALQLAMLQSAFVRTHDARRVLAAAATGTTIVIERPLQENMIFERANHRSGNLTDDAHARYKQYAAHMFDTLYAGDDNVATLAIQLWAPEARTLETMIDRGRLAEDAYDNAYLQELAHSYFLATLEIYLRRGIAEGPVTTTGRPTPPLQVPLVVDWTAFGTWTYLLDLLTRERLEWALQRGTVRIVTERVAPDEDAQVLEFGAYLTNHGRGPQGRAFRDAFFKCRADMTPVVLVLPDAVRYKTLVADDLQIYAGLTTAAAAVAPLVLPLGSTPSPFAFSMSE